MDNFSLAQLQKSVQNFLLDKPTDIEKLTLETPQFSREQRLQIYHEAYRLRLVDALRNDFPALEMQLGDDDFFELANAFITNHPSENPSLRWLGEKFPAFIQCESARKSDIHLAELASFEWAQAMAFDAEDIAIVTVDELRKLQPEQWMSLGLQLHPSIQQLQFFSNAPNVWSALIKDQEHIDIEMAEAPQDWLVWREALQVVYRPIAESEAWSIQSFSQGQNFAEICGGLGQWFDEDKVPMQAAHYLQQWLLGGLIIGISV